MGRPYLATTLLVVLMGSWACNESSAPVEPLATQFVETWGNSDLLDGQLGRPTALAVEASTGNVFVYDGWGSYIHIFSPLGVFLTRWQAEDSFQDRGMALDNRGSVFLTDPQHHRIFQYTQEGALVNFWGVQGSNPGELLGPTGIAVGNGGRIYVADAGNDRIQVFDAEGTFLFAWGTHGTGSGEFDGPVSISVDPSGSVYVGDWRNYRVQKFDSDGNWLLQFGDYGLTDGRFQSLHLYVSACSNGDVLVFEGRWRVNRFDGNGEFVHSWSAERRVGGGNSGIATDAEGVVYTSNFGYFEGVEDFGIQAFSTDGSFLRKFGTPRNTGPGQFAGAAALAVAPDGSVLIGERLGRIQRLDRRGTYVGEWQLPSAEEDLVDLGVGPDASVFALRGETEPDEAMIERFTPGGELRSRWSVSAAASGLAVDQEGRVWICDRDLNRVFIYGAEGNALGSWGEPGQDVGELWKPLSIAVADGFVTVCDAKAVAVFYENGQFKLNLLVWETNAFPDSYFRVGADEQGIIYALSYNQQVSMFNANGTLRGHFNHADGIVRDIAAESIDAIYILRFDSLLKFRAR